MKAITSWFIILAPFAIILADWLVLYWFGTEATITGVVRGWNEQSVWPEALFLFGMVLLYLHLFREFL